MLTDLLHGGYSQGSERHTHITSMPQEILRKWIQTRGLKQYRLDEWTTTPRITLRHSLILTGFIDFDWVGSIYFKLRIIGLHEIWTFWYTIQFNNFSEIVDNWWWPYKAETCCEKKGGLIICCIGDGNILYETRNYCLNLVEANKFFPFCRILTISKGHPYSS
jgi:hypothetical protein